MKNYKGETITGAKHGWKCFKINRSETGREDIRMDLINLRDSSKLVPSNRLMYLRVIQLVTTKCLAIAYHGITLFKKIYISF
jgi:hypothetical protein